MKVNSRQNTERREECVMKRNEDGEAGGEIGKEMRKSREGMKKGNEAENIGSQVTTARDKERRSCLEREPKKGTEGNWKMGKNRVKPEHKSGRNQMGTT